VPRHPTLVVTPRTVEAPEVQSTPVTLKENLAGVSDVRTVIVPPGGTVNSNITVVNGKLVKTVTVGSATFPSLNATVDGQGIVSSPGTSIAGSADISGSLLQTVNSPFSAVDINISSSELVAGIGDLLLGASDSAFSSIRLTADLSVPSQGLDFPVFQGLASIQQQGTSMLT
jgi:hypothetical protein